MLVAVDDRILRSERAGLSRLEAGGLSGVDGRSL